MPISLVKKIRAFAPISVALFVGILIGANLRGPAAEEVALRRPSPPSSTSTNVTTETTTPTTAPTTTVPAPPPTTAPPPPAPVVPTGKGMWIWQPEYAEQGDPAAIVARAQATGLSHLYIRMGSSVDGFTAAPFLDALLPVAHAAGIRIIGWDFPYLDNLVIDVDRAAEAIRYTTPTGDRIDGFSADIETPLEYVALTSENAALYGAALRNFAGPSYLLIATVPRPSLARQADYPYTEVVASFDAIAPMVYWIDQPPDAEAATAVDFLAQFGKPVLPIGQAYDSGLEGGSPGSPTADEITNFVDGAVAHGAAGVSFWSWQHASDEMWGAIAAAPPVGVIPNG